MILIDTGPLLALFDPKDKDHATCHVVLGDLAEPLYTTEAVLTDVLHLLTPASRGAEGVKRFVLKGYVACLPLQKSTLQRCFELMSKYADVPMDFADATLISLAEKYEISRLFTLDFQDFRVYRAKRGHRYYPLELIGAELLG